ncbi:MAG: hypothetical protein LBT67_00395 [Holosporaceae bacterium]|jgi:hypothetical protein|nr:hypothetical protein [Holosporaceae bacterium]
MKYIDRICTCVCLLVVSTSAADNAVTLAKVMDSFPVQKSDVSAFERNCSSFGPCDISVYENGMTPYGDRRCSIELHNKGNYACIINISVKCVTKEDSVGSYDQTGDNDDVTLKSLTVKPGEKIETSVPLISPSTNDKFYLVVSKGGDNSNGIAKTVTIPVVVGPALDTLREHSSVAQR